MVNDLEKLKDYITLSLEKSSLAYFDTGMEKYQNIEDGLGNEEDIQTSFGCISIACELLLKTFIAKKLFLCLYPSLSKDKQAVLFYPEAMEHSKSNIRIIDSLKTSSEKMIGMSEAVSFFYQLYPDEKKDYESDLRELASQRNIAVHAVFLDYKYHNLKKLIYVISKLFLLAIDNNIIEKKNAFEYKKIVEYYDKDANELVSKKIEAAKKCILNSVNCDCDTLTKAYTIQEVREESCPVCENNANSYGYIEETSSFITFHALVFRCNKCGLSLNDDKELKLASIETNYTEPTSLFLCEINTNSIIESL